MADTARSVASRLAPHTQSDVRRRNLWLVLQNIRAAGTTTRVRIARETGLTGTTVHRLTDELERRALVRQVAPDVRAGVGRPPLMFCFDGRIGHVAGIDVGNETTRAALADLNGKELTRTTVPTASIEGNLPLALEQMVGDLQRREMLRRDRLVAIGVGVAAVTGAEGTIIRASMHHLWEGLQLGLELRRQMGCEVVVSQDDHLAALAELEVGACVGLRDAIVVNIGKGVGVGIITDGAIHPGAHGAAGRVGWIPAPEWAADDGPAARETRLVPLANLLTADGLIADFIRYGGTGEMDGARAVFAAAESGDVAADRAVDTFADRLGWAIGTVVALFDPQRVVVGGGISGSFDRLAAPVAARVAAIVAVPPPIVASTLGTGAVVSGAIASAARLADGWLSTRLKG